MYTFSFTYSDKRVAKFDHINEVQYSYFEDTVVKGDDILHHQFPLNCNLHLYSEKTNHTVSSTNLTSITVTKE